MKTVIQLFPDSGYYIAVELETAHEITEKESEDARFILETAYGPFDPDESVADFNWFRKQVGKLNPELAEQVQSIT